MKYFWLEKHLDQWREAIRSNHKPQAVIISGANGMGKKKLLNLILAELLCRQPEAPCGQCQNCLLFSQGHHPDINSVEPENGIVKVKMIRQLTQFFTSTPHCANYKIAIIDEADTMNLAAANSLLKVLEEPPSRGILFLLTSFKHQLMPTIRSRCINMDVVLNPTEKSQLAGWLKSHYEGGEKDADKVLIFNDFQPLLATKMLASNELASFDQMLAWIYAAINNEGSVTAAAKNLADCSYELWELLHRYFIWLAKSMMQEKDLSIDFNHALNQLIKNSPKVFHILIKITELVQNVMLNLNTQVKSQLLIESMLIEIKNELIPKR